MYTWNSKELMNMAVFPRVAGDALKVATFTQLKVLFWIATNGQDGVDAASCAAALGSRFTEADCEDALAFWEQEGVLARTEAATPAPAKKTTKPTKASAEKPAAPTVLAERSALIPTATVAPASVQVRKTVDPKEFAGFLHEVEARFGKPLSRADQDRLLDLCELSALPSEVLLMIVAYACKNDKGRVRYIQSVAQSWEEKRLFTVEAADKYLCHLEQCDKAWETLLDWLSLDIDKPTVSQKELAEKWIHTFGQQQPLIALAYAKCVEKTGTFKASYMDRILCAWHEDGITTPAQAETPRKKSEKKPTKAPGQGGFDVDKYEKMIENRSSRFRKKD